MDADRRILRSESDHRAFIRNYFNTDIADPANYDLVINTGSVSISNAVRTIAFALGA